MKVSERSFLTQRAEQLAILILSRRDELVISETQGPQDYGFDLVVNITHDGQLTGRMFGVKVKAHRALQPVSIGDGTYKIDLPRVIFPQDLPFPLCLFVLDMESDEGYYRWLLSPVLTAKCEPKLLLNQERAFRKLSEEELDRMIQLVDTWYEKRASLVLV